MPETLFSLRWPDGSQSVCYSPSSVVQQHLSRGARYTVRDFLDRCRNALSLASERVRSRYGYPCSRALAQLREIEAQAKAFEELPSGEVTVVGFHNSAANHATDQQEGLAP